MLLTGMAVSRCIVAARTFDGADEAGPSGRWLGAPAWRPLAIAGSSNIRLLSSLSCDLVY